MARLKNNLIASSLIEVMTAMIIIMIVYGIALTIFMNTARDYNSFRKMYAYFLLQEEVIKTKKEFSFLDEEYQKADFIIKKTVYPYKKSGNIDVLHIKILNKNGKLVIERKELVGR